MAGPSCSSDISPLESGEEGGVWWSVRESGGGGGGGKDEQHVANMKNGRRRKT